MHRNNLIMLVIAGLQAIVLAGLWFFGGNQDAAETQRGGPLTEMKREAIREIAITADPKSEPLRLKRGADDDTWVIASAHDYPADASKIATLLDKLTAVTLGRPVIRSAENHAPVKVAADDFGRRLALKGDGGEKIFFLNNGSRMGTAYLRRDGEDLVYETEGIETWDLRAELSAWTDAETMKFDAKAIQSFELALGEKKFRFEQRSAEGEDAKWWLTSPEEAEVKDDAAQQVLDDLAGLRVEGVLGLEAPADRGFDAPAAQATLVPKEGEPFTIAIGKKSEEDSRRAIKSSRSRWYVDASAWSLDSMLEKTIDDFREAPKPEEPAASDAADEPDDK
jgi:uncharacterized protein DUF4340